MTRFITNSKSLIETLVALSLVATVSLVGCGTDLSTAPEYLSIESDDGPQPGELPLPGKINAVEAPIGLTLASIGPNGAVINWVGSSAGLVAHIDLNGVRIATVNATAGTFTDNLAKSPGLYRYSVCFENMTRKMGAMKRVEGEVFELPEGTDRTDDGIEDGR